MALLKHIPEFSPLRRTEAGSVPTGVSYRSWLTHTLNSLHTHTHTHDMSARKSKPCGESAVTDVKKKNTT